MAQLFDVCV